MNVKLIGIGAAGNKAAINAVENNVIAIENVMLINSTLRDIPADYKGLKIEYAGSYGGCGKERNIAFDLAMKNLQEGVLPLEEFLCLEDEAKRAELVVIVNSTEGGTGSGSSVVIGKYIQQVLGIQVHMFGFAGFQSDVRGLKNTVEWFQELEGDFTVECIENSKFLAECRDNKIKAEKAANVEFGKKLGILMGNPIRDSSHNIDATDLLKVSTEKGFMIIESANFEKIKNREQFESVVINMIDDSKSIDIAEITSKKIAVIININAASTDFISYEDILNERYGNPYEMFLHIQHEADMPEFIAVIVSGVKMPVEEVQKIHSEYKARMNRIDRTADSFFAASKNLQLDDDSDLSLQTKKATVAKSDFFGSMTKKATEVKKDKMSEY
jgi:cell division GTPase FtsZ